MQEIGKSNTGIKKAVGLWAKKTGLDFNKAKIGGKKPRGISFKVLLSLNPNLSFSKIHRRLLTRWFTEK